MTALKKLLSSANKVNRQMVYSEYLLTDMTDRQEQLLNTALTLFAERGFHATSTSAIAKAAGVSEGLLFKHFKNKAGLLEAILQQGEERTGAILEDALSTGDALELLRNVVRVPFVVPESDHVYFRLLFKLKWEMNRYGTAAYYEVLRERLEWAFEELSYHQPKLQAQNLQLQLDATASAIVRNEIPDPAALMRFQLSRFDE